MLILMWHNFSFDEIVKVTITLTIIVIALYIYLYQYLSYYKV